MPFPTTQVPHSHGPTNPGQTRVRRCETGLRGVNKKWQCRERTKNDDEVQALLAMWVDATIQRQLLGMVQNTTVFNKIADESARKGYQRSS